MTTFNKDYLLKREEDSVQVLSEIKKEFDILNGLIDNYPLKQINKNQYDQTLQPLFRIYIRSAFASIEALCFNLKQISLLAHKRLGKTITKTDMEKFTEKRQNGTPKYLKVEDNIKFTFEKLFDIGGQKFQIDKHEVEKKLKDPIRVRHRITHPKNISDLYISDEDFRLVKESLIWVMIQIKLFTKLSVK